MHNPTAPQHDPAPNDSQERRVLYNFTKQGLGDWDIQDDVVMGGVSDSQLSITEEGFANWNGSVSLENNGGFCSFQCVFEDDPFVVKGRSAFFLRAKGDGKDYSLRVRTPNGRHSYAFTFPTKTGQWENITIPFAAMAGTYRGEDVDVPNYAGEDVKEMQILIGNGKAQDFTLLVEAVGVI